MGPRMVAGCRWLVNRPAFHLTVMGLIVLSIVLLTWDITMAKTNPWHEPVDLAQDFITLLFIGELVVRFLAYKRRGRFFRDYWLDILAVVAVFPVFRLFRLARFLRLLRLLRMFRVASTLTNNSRLLHLLLEQRLTEYFLIVVMLGASVLMGTMGLTYFEHPHSGVAQMQESFWTVLFSLTSTQYSTDYPPTLGGKLTILFTLFCGLTFFAVLTGTVSAIMIEKIKEGSILGRTELDDLENHVIICGWNSGVEILISEIQGHADFWNREIVIIAERDDLPDMPLAKNRALIRLVKEDFTRVEVLRRANVTTASVAVIVSDVAHGRSRQDADARTVLASLTIEKLAPSVHTCAELSNSMNEHHLRLGQINEVVVTQDMAGRLLAQAAMDSSRSRVLHQLLHPDEHTTLHPIRVEDTLVGTPFAAVIGAFPGSIPVAVQSVGGDVRVNPVGHVLAEGETLLCVGVPKKKNY